MSWFTFSSPEARSGEGAAARHKPDRHFNLAFDTGLA